MLLQKNRVVTRPYILNKTASVSGPRILPRAPELENEPMANPCSNLDTDFDTAEFRAGLANEYPIASGVIANPKLMILSKLKSGRKHPAIMVLSATMRVFFSPIRGIILTEKNPCVMTPQMPT